MWTMGPRILNFSEVQNSLTSKKHSDDNSNEAVEVVSDTCFKAPTQTDLWPSTYIL